MSKESVVMFPPVDEENTSSSKELIARMSEPNPLVARDLDRQGIIHSRTRNNEAYDAFRDLRTELLQRSGNENFIVLVTSVIPGGGATHVAVNLASAIAFDRSKTALVVDCNVYNPAVHKVLGIDRSPGLTDFLSDPDGVNIEEIIRPTGIARVRALPVGLRPARNDEYFGSVNMKLLMHMLQQRYSDRFVVVDAPSMNAKSDARMLAELSDQVVVVVPYGKVTGSRVQDACQTFTEDKLSGVVFNRIPPLSNIW